MKLQRKNDGEHPQQEQNKQEAQDRFAAARIAHTVGKRASIAHADEERCPGRACFWRWALNGPDVSDG